MLLSAYNVLLSKYSGQEDIVVGTPVEGRRHGELRDVIGMFVNTLAIRTRPAGDKTYQEFLAEVAEDLYSAYDNQDYPFEVLVEKAGVPRDTSRSPLFDTMFVLQNMDLGPIETRDFTAAPAVFDNGTSKFDLTLEASDKGGTIAFTLEYCTDLFREETIERLSAHFLGALGDIVKNPQKKLCEVDILSSAERRQLLLAFNDTDADYPRDKTLGQLFEEQATKTPVRTALLFDNMEMTYRALNERANRLARTLRAQGIGPDVIVGLLIDRSFEMLVSILGILKAGGAYLPIDPDYPAERRTYMLEDSGAKLLLTKRAFSASFSGPVIFVDDENAYNADGTNPAPGEQTVRPLLHHLHLRLHRPPEGHHDTAPGRRQLLLEKPQ